MTPEKDIPPRNRPATTKRKIWLAIIYGILAITFAVLASYTLDNIWLFIALFLPALFLGRLSIRHFRPRFTGDSIDVKLDDREPVLFLRPFDKDSGWDGAASFSVYRPRTWRKALLLTPTNLTALFLEMTGRNSFEQVLAFVTRKIGPMVAIGEPGNPPILGAKNIYVGDDNWQEEVIELAQRSKLVVLTAGTSPRVLWEVGTVVEQVPPQRLLLNIPGSTRGERKENYEKFSQAAQGLFPFGLPETVDGDRFLSFRENWEPAEIPKRVSKKDANSPVWIASKMTRLLI